MPKHDFLLLPETDGNYADYMQHFNSPDAVKVDDNILVRTILDTLQLDSNDQPSESRGVAGVRTQLLRSHRNRQGGSRQSITDFPSLGRITGRGTRGVGTDRQLRME